MMLTDALMKYAVFTGRARRSEFWGFVLLELVLFFVAFVLDILTGTSHDGSMGLFLALTVLALFIPGWAVTVRRLHDTDKSGWLALIGFVPLVGGVILFVLMLLDSDSSLNRYGPNPKYLSVAPEMSAAASVADPVGSGYISNWVLSGFDAHGNRLRFSIDSNDEQLRRYGLIIGREPENADLAISSSSISRRHARIFFSDNDLWIEDLNSMNGTLLDGNQLEQGRAGVFSNGARLMLGDVELIFTKMI